MKKASILVFVLLGPFVSFSQTDTIKIEQYCQVIATPRLLSDKITIEIDFGEQKSFGETSGLKLMMGN